MRQTTRPKEPVPEDFGMTPAEYHEAKLTLKRANSTDDPFSRWWIAALVLLGLSLWLNWGVGILLFMLCAGTAKVMDYVAHRTAQKEETAHRNNLLQKIRPYEVAVVAYQQELVRYNHRREQYWKSLGGIALENELATLYRKLGYRVETTKATGDEGIDLILRKDGATVLVQCKGHSKPIGVGAIRDLYGTLMHHEADHAILVCPVGFTQGVVRFVQGKPIDLVSAQEIVTMVDEAEGTTPSQSQVRFAVRTIR